MRHLPERDSRRDFIKQTAAAVAGVAWSQARDIAGAQAPERPRAPSKTLYSNDTTNIISCISPYHKKGDPLTDEMIRASVAEAKGVDVHMLQPGLGWIAWWKSDVAPADEHYRWLQREFGVAPNSFGKYMLAGGDVVQAFVDGCRATDVAPFVSYRLNDGHHVRDLEKALAEGRPSPSISRFYWENYEKYRIGPDTKDWAQGVFNWAIPEVRDHKFALIQEIAAKYDIEGLELDFLRHWSFFRLDETTSRQRREIMTQFVGRVRKALDATAREGRRRWLCVRVPALLACHDQLGIDLPSMVDAGADMVNLSASYYTTQSADLPRIRTMVPGAALYLEMTHTTLTGKALAGSGTQPYLRTTDAQCYTTAHLAYTRGADGVSLFNFVYYREHKLEGLGPFDEPPFHVLPKLKDPQWLARQPQWYFLSGFSIKPPIAKRMLPTKIEPGRERVFKMAMAPTSHQTRDGLLRLRAEGEIGDRHWRVRVNGIELAPTGFVRKPLDHPYEGFLGEPPEHACFVCPRSAVRSGDNEIRVAFTQGETVKLIFLELTLP